MADMMNISILEDGTIKIETGKVSAANHVNAEAFIRECFTMAGGKSKRVLKAGASLHHALHVHAADGHTHGPDGHHHH